MKFVILCVSLVVLFLLNLFVGSVDIPPRAGDRYTFQ